MEKSPDNCAGYLTHPMQQDKQQAVSSKETFEQSLELLSEFVSLPSPKERFQQQVYFAERAAFAKRQQARYPDTIVVVCQDLDRTSDRKTQILALPKTWTLAKVQTHLRSSLSDTTLAPFSTLVLFVDHTLELSIPLSTPLIVLEHRKAEDGILYLYYSEQPVFG